MADIVYQQAARIHTFAQCVVQIGIVGAYGTAGLVVGIGIQFVEVDVWHLLGHVLCHHLARVGKHRVVRRAWVGIVGQQGHVVAPVATGIVGQQVAPRHVAFYLVHQVVGLVGRLGGQASHTNVERLGRNARLVLAQVAHHIVGGIGLPRIVERVGCFIRHHNGQVVFGDVAVVEGGFAKQQQILWSLVGIAVGHVAQQGADGHRVLHASRVFVEHLLVGNHQAAHAIHHLVQCG